MGVIEAMISSIKDNRKVRGKQKTMRDRGEDYSYEDSAPLEFKDSMTAEDHAQHKKAWAIRKKKSQRNLLVIFGSLILLIALGIVYLAT
ncbi:MAG: hypothetical protein P8P74_02610 [Crocinitomicaceae bacterium]|nr:hypothetical protein [Crocinitomicaceae bacterium]